MKDSTQGGLAELFIALMIVALIAVIALKSPPAKTSPAPEVIRTEIEMEVTAYCAGECCCQQWADGFFADGSPVGGKAIAADTRYYPMGTVFDVPGYGVATVKDRGGAIKGDKLDLYFPTHQEALNWGRKTLTVKILKNLSTP